VYYATQKQCYLYTAASSSLAGAPYTYDYDAFYMELLGYTQAVATTPLTCTHAANKVTNTGVVARCKYDWDAWGNSGPAAGRSKLSRCLSADASCVYNPLSIVYDAGASISAGWERSAARSYTSSSEIATPTSWSAAEKFDGAT
jgi:hypothetical protein